MHRWTFVLTVVAMAIAVADFLIGSTIRRRLRDKMVDWWIFLAETSYFGIAKREVEWVSRRFHALFGAPLRGARFYVVNITMSIVVTSIMAGTTFLIYERTGKESIGELLLDLPKYWFGALWAALQLEDFFTGIYVGNIVGDVLTMAATLFLLKKMTSVMRPSALVGLLLVDLMLACVGVMLVLAITAAFDDYNTHDKFPFVAPIAGVRQVPEYIARIAAGDKEVIAISLPALVGVVPTLIHMLLLSAVMATKVLTPVLRPVALLIVHRLSEADRGVVALIVTVLVALAKIIEAASRA